MFTQPSASIDKLVLIIFISICHLNGIAQESYYNHLDANLKMTLKRKAVYLEKVEMWNRGIEHRTIYDLKRRKTDLVRMNVNETGVKMGSFLERKENGDITVSGKFNKVGDTDVYRMILNEVNDTVDVTFEGPIISPIYLSFFTDGSARQNKYFKNRLRHGTWQSWYENGQKRSEIFFNDGVCTGETKMWWPNGSPMLTVEKEVSELGRKVSTFYRSGTTCKETWITDDQHLRFPKSMSCDSSDLDALNLAIQFFKGEVFKYHENGVLKEKTENYKEGKTEYSKSYEYDDNGNMTESSFSQERGKTSLSVLSIYKENGTLDKRKYSNNDDYSWYSFESAKDSLEISEDIEISDETYTIVESMPEYPGGQAEMFKFISENTIFPTIAKENGISGTSFLTFVIEKDGSLSGLRVLLSDYTLFGLEGMRVLRLMPDWNPGIQRDKAVKVQFNLPYRFILQ
jgi:protein TonB